MKLLHTNGFTPSARNLGRLLFIMQNAFWSSFFTWREKKKYGKQIDSWNAPDNPVIIIGHWRTGSTFLQLLMAQDRQFVTPSVFQAILPESFLNAEKYYRPVMGRLLNKRPMDNVHLGFDDAQEDEFALLKLTRESPLLDNVFPNPKGYFINYCDDFNPAPEDYPRWKKELITFCKKILQGTDKTLLLKNPAHSLRIPFLQEAFPNVRFIHIHRHPYQVVASSLNLWRVMINDNLLKGKPVYPSLEEVTRGLEKFYSIIMQDLASVPATNKAEIAYEDLVANPGASLKGVYDQLGLDFSTELEERITSFLERNKDFKKNSYTFEAKDKEKVFRLMEKYFEHYNYQR